MPIAVDPKILAKAQELSSQVVPLAISLQGQVEWSHEKSLDLITSAMILNLLTEIRDELKILNQAKK